MKCKCPTCGTTVHASSVVFDDTFIVNIEDEAAFDEIVTQAGKDRFRFPAGHDFVEIVTISQARFLEYLTSHTDLIIEHDDKHWDNLPEWED